MGCGVVGILRHFDYDCRSGYFGLVMSGVLVFVIRCNLLLFRCFDIDCPVEDWKRAPTHINTTLH